ncbi:hypothetical protein ACIRO3_14730 [Streptomyces sp. NPDC102278]|uniref:hypothetical protein n=1 Tax=Streptomyces sp. NPDC102278 TaxID=3366152 RepID=UPI00381170B5
MVQQGRDRRGVDHCADQERGVDAESDPQVGLDDHGPVRALTAAQAVRVKDGALDVANDVESVRRTTTIRRRKSVGERLLTNVLR